MDEVKRLEKNSKISASLKGKKWTPERLEAYRKRRKELEAQGVKFGRKKKNLGVTESVPVKAELGVKL